MTSRVRAMMAGSGRQRDLAARAESTYGAAADHFDDPALGFWRHFGEQTIERVGPRPGDRVLDLCCGSGESVIPAARTVGPTGSVLGVDVSAPMIGLASEKARRAGLTNVRLVRADAANTGLPAGGFDAVAVARSHPLAHREDFWQIVLGTGYRATVDSLSTQARRRVRERVLERLRHLQVTAVRTDVVYGWADKMPRAEPA